MILKQYYLGCLAHASYLIGDESSGVAAVVDPRRDVDLYLDAAAAKGRFFSTNDDEDENDASRDASRRSSPRGFRTSSSGDAYHAYRSNADDDARDGGSLSPKPPPRVPKPPRRATPPPRR